MHVNIPAVKPFALVGLLLLGLTGCNDEASTTQTIEPTLQVTLSDNLHANSVPPEKTFSATDPSSYNHYQTRTIYDSLLQPHTLEVFFTKQVAGSTHPANTWLMYTLIDGHQVGDPAIPDGDATTAYFRLIFMEQGELNDALSEHALISNWTPRDAEGQPNGALGPMNQMDGASLPVPSPATSSNFEIDVTQMTQRGSGTGQTTQVSPKIQLDALATPLTIDFHPDDRLSYHARSEHTLYDSLGISHPLVLYYIKQSLTDTQQRWQVIAQINGHDVGDPSPDEAPYPVTATQASYTLVFTSSGQVDDTQSDRGLVTYWRPMDAEGNLTGASGPTGAEYAVVPIPVPAVSSNFVIEFSEISLTP